MPAQDLLPILEIYLEKGKALRLFETRSGSRISKSCRIKTEYVAAYATLSEIYIRNKDNS